MGTSSPLLFFDPGSDYRTLATSKQNSLQIQRLYFDYLLIRYTDESLLDYYLVEVCTMTQHWTPKSQRCGDCGPGQFTLWFGQQACLNCSDYSSLAVLVAMEQFYRDKVLAVCPNASATYKEAQMSGALLPLSVGAVNTSIPSNVTQDEPAGSQTLALVGTNITAKAGGSKVSKKTLYVAVIVPVSLAVLAFVSYVIWACTRKNDAVYNQGSIGNAVIIDDLDGTKPREVCEVKHIINSSSS